MLLLSLGVSVSAQSLRTHRDYYDWLETKIYHKWTTRPDGKYHGDFITYRRNGSVYSIENYNNGKYSSFRHLFDDGTIASTGKVIEKSSMDAYNTCKEYSLYLISNSGKRTLRMQSKLYQQTKPDSLGDYTINRNLGWGNSRTCFMYDYRLESYSEYHSNGKISLRFTVSPDKNLETIMKYDETGKLLIHQVYNIKKGNLSWIVHDEEDSSFTIRNNVVTLNEDMQITTEGGLIYNYKTGSTFNNTLSIPMSRAQFYEDIITCAEDDCTKNYVVQVSYPVSINLEKNFSQLTEKNVEKEEVGRVLKMRIDYPNGWYITWEGTVLEALDKSSQLYGNIRENSHIKVYYEQDSIVYIDYLSKDGKVFAFKGGIKNLKPEGKVTMCYSDYESKHTYEGECHNGMLDGEGILCEYDLNNNEIYRYQGTFSQNNKLQGRQVYHDGREYDGTWNNDKYQTGVSKELENQIDTVYTYYTKGKAEATLYKSGKTGASFKTLSPITADSPGQGVYITSNQDRYEGLFTSNDISSGELQLHHFIKGKAELKLENGDCYIGECVTTGINSAKIVFEGTGQLIKSNGDYYKGAFSKSEFLGNGEVRVTDRKNKIYEGKYQNNLPNGEGKLIYPTGTVLLGDFKMGVPINQCEIRYPNGEIYKGLVLDEQPNGQGIYTYKNGAVYDGQWARGQRHGSGKLTTSLGAVYEGFWMADKLNGEVTITHCNNFYKFTYKKGVIGKTAFVQFENGDKFEGQIENGGYKSGKYTFNNGVTYSGSWIGGKPDKVKVTDAQGVKVSTKEAYEYREVCVIDKRLLDIQ